MRLSVEDYAELKTFSSQAEGGRLKEALSYAQGLLERDPHSVDGLCLGSYCLRRLGNGVAAYHYSLAAIREDPNNAALWLNLGGAAQSLWLPDIAENAYTQAIKYATDLQHQAVIWLNLASLHIDSGNFDEGERCTRKCLELSPGRKSAIANLGMCQLARREWREGWKNYREVIGGDFCPKVQYLEEPQWAGEPDQVVAIYEVEGIGDAVSFASVLPDAIAHCKKVIFDCDPKLEHLFARSFPKATVYGTRRETGTSGRTWSKKDRIFDASLPLSQLGQFFRNEETDFPGTPYLVPCPIRTAMWRERFATLRKPVIGIAWSGGVARTNARFRQLTLEQMLPILKSVDAHWVSLQYKDAGTEIARFHVEHPSIDLVQYPWATLTKDYDDTAALIAACDQVICMQTAVAHTAGALGIPVTVLLPTATTWRYGSGAVSIPWYRSMSIVRQETHGQWTDEIERVAAHLRELPGAASPVARPGQLRGDGREARGNGQCHH